MDDPWPFVWTVHPRNLTAIAFYERLGATFSDDMLVTWPTD
jgi:RimJ/RimL family protein N-acetyltransferase